MTSNFLTVDEVIAIHDDLIIQFGGPPGLRDMGALESAVLRPQMGYYDGVIGEAAALMESLAMNHPFVDGNKRVCLVAMELFLLLNGHELSVGDAQCLETILALADGSLAEDALAEWLRAHIAP